MENHEFDIEIRTDGKVKIHMKGIKGPVCMEYAKLFEKIIGRTDDINQTSEYYEPPSNVKINLEQKLKT